MQCNLMMYLVFPGLTAEDEQDYDAPTFVILGQLHGTGTKTEKDTFFPPQLLPSVNFNVVISSVYP